MQIEPFGVEIWMNEWETRCEWNLAETCVESLTIAELLALAGKDEACLSELMTLKMTYGAIEGSDRLRAVIATLYAHQEAGNVSRDPRRNWCEYARSQDISGDR